MSQHQAKVKTVDTQKTNNTISKETSEQKNFDQQKQLLNAGETTPSDWANVQARMNLPGPTSKVQFSANTQPVANPNSIHSVAASGLSGPSRPLPYLNQIQKLFGSYDISNIRSYMGSKANAANRILGSEAYATGNSIAFAKKPSLFTAAHEATHIIQQQAGIYPRDSVGKIGDKYEREANAVANAVTAGKSAASLLNYSQANISNNFSAKIAPVQMLNAGLIPKFPAKYRKSDYPFEPNITHYSKKPFAENQKKKIYKQNFNQHKNLLIKAKYNAPLEAISDYSNKLLLNPKKATMITPEVDHVVPRVEGGSNDERNARILSKAENNNHEVGRPLNFSKSFVVYDALEFFERKAPGKAWHRKWQKKNGDRLDLKQIKQVLRVANIKVSGNFYSRKVQDDVSNFKDKLKINGNEKLKVTG